VSWGGFVDIVIFRHRLVVPLFWAYMSLLLRAAIV